MTTSTAVDRFASLHEPVPLNEYNYAHFRTKHLVRDVQRTLGRAGISPGEMAPDFEMPRTGGDSLRLSDLRGSPVLLHFGSLS